METIERIFNLIVADLIMFFSGRWLQLFTANYIDPISRSMTARSVINRVAGIKEMWAQGKDISRPAIKDIVKTFYATDGAWIEFVSEYLTNMGVDRAQFDKLRAAGVRFSDPQTMQLIGESFLQPLLNLIVPTQSVDFKGGGVTPEGGIRAAERYLAANLQFQMNAWYLHMIGDTISLGAFKSLKDLPNAISWSYGLGWLSWLVMGVPFQTAITGPMQQYYNAKLRPARYSFGQTIKLFNSGMITSQDAYKHLSELGYTDEKIVSLMLIETEQPSAGEVRSLVERGTWNLEDVRCWHRNRGMPEPLATTLATEIGNSRYYSLVEDMLKTAGRAYIDEKIAWDYLDALYTAHHYTPNERGIIKRTLDWQKEMKAPEEAYARTLTPANIGRLYQLEHYSFAQAQAKLIGVGFDTTVIADFLALYPPVKAKPEEPKEIPVGTLGAMYKNKVISETEFRSELRDMEFSSQDIDRYERLYKPVAPKPVEPRPPRELPVTMVGKLYRDGFASRAWAEQHLLRLDMRAEDIQILLDTIYQPLPPEVAEPKRLPVSILGGLWRRGLISTTEFERYLVQLEYPSAEVAYYKLYYTEEPPPPQEPTPPTELSLSTVGSLHRGQYISTAEGVRRLLLIGIREADARLLLTTLYQPPEPEEPVSKQLSTSQIGTLYREGKIPEAEAVQMWLDQRWTVQDTKKLLQLYEKPVEIPPAPTPPKGLEPSVIGRLYRLGGLTRQQAIDRLLDANYTPEDINLLLDYIYVSAEPAVSEPRRLTTQQIGNLYSTKTIDLLTASDLMAELHYTDRDIAYILFLYQPVEPLPPAPIVPKDLNPTTVGTLYRNARIRYIDAVYRLRTVPYTDQDIVLFLSLYIYDSMIITVVQQYKDKSITKEQAVRLLKESLLNDEEIQLILQYM